MESSRKELRRRGSHQKSKQRDRDRKSKDELTPSAATSLDSEDEHGIRKADLISEALAFERKTAATWNDEIRLLALQDGGLLHNKLRKPCWLRILNLDEKGISKLPLKDESSIPDPTMRQIDLDVARSMGDIKIGASEKRVRLKSSMLRFFRRNPDLSYYQGFHDVFAVYCDCFEDQNSQIAVAEVLSRHFIFRDAHAKDFATVERLLRTVQWLVDKSDPKCGERLKGSPYWGLSMLITCFAHDVSSRETKLRIFDAVVSSHPHFPLYLTAALPLLPNVKAKLLLEDDLAQCHAIIIEAARSIKSIKNADHLIRAARNLMEKFPPQDLIQTAELEGILTRESCIFANFPFDSRWCAPPKLSKQSALVLKMKRWVRTVHVKHQFGIWMVTVSLIVLFTSYHLRR